MYNNKLLLESIDALLISTEGKLSEEEFDKLKAIRAEICLHAGNHLTVDDFIKLVTFLSMLKDLL